MGTRTRLMVKSLPSLNVCNLCLNKGAVKSMLVSQKHGVNFVDMLQKCFSLDITVLDVGGTKLLICEQCSRRLLDAAAFREQVETSLRTLKATVKLKLGRQKLFIQRIDEEPIAKLKPELRPVFDDFSAADDDDEDDNMRNEKEPVDETPKKIRQKIIKTKDSRLARLPEIEAMLSSGLFPFKICQDLTFSCIICPENSTNLDNIEHHVKNHSKNNINIAFKKMKFSKSNRFYKNATSIRCKICTTDLNNYGELKEHIESCSRFIPKFKKKLNDLPFKLERNQLDCPVCKKTFLNFVGLNIHMNLHYPNFICDSCGKTFASKPRFKNHMRIHEIGSFKCRYCPAVFDRITKREHHVSKEHKVGHRYACRQCNIFLPSFYARQKHLAEVHNEEKRYKCKACSRSFIVPGQLSSHLRQFHLNERNHKCDICDRAFFRNKDLMRHMTMHGGKERTHVCNVCQKSYLRKDTLRQHMRTHTNEQLVCQNDDDDEWSEQ